MRHNRKPDRLDLFMVHAGAHEPALASGLEPKHVARAPRPDVRPRDSMYADDADPNQLETQRWGIIAPRGEVGDHLIDVVAPLIAHRQRQQGGRDVCRYRVPARMTLEQAGQWKKRAFRKGNDVDDDLPRYLLILGDLHEVPLALQQILSTDCFVGRLAFDHDAEYRAYVDKLLGWERRCVGAGSGRALLYSTCDDPVTRRGYEALVAPGGDILRDQRDRGALDVEHIEVMGERDPSPDQLWRLATTDRPSVLFSLSHGLGAPVAGWGSFERQRREQGALSFGRNGALFGDDLDDRTFLPGGMWFLFACFGAGTPDHSAYYHWLNTLSGCGRVGNETGHVGSRTGHVGNETGRVGSQIGHVVNSLASERPFIAAVPRAALASPAGPLCVIGHIDLAWSYSFVEIDGRAMKRPGRFMKVLQSLLRGARAGVAMSSLTRSFEQVNTDLTNLYDRDASRGRTSLSARDRARLGHLWMLRQDLAGYVLLGDPAARLPRTMDDGLASLDDRVVAAVTRVLCHGARLRDVAGAHGLQAEDLKRWSKLYRDAGCRAVRDALRAHRADPERGA